MVIRPAQAEDATYWERMRQSLWPSSKREHASEIARYFAGNTREPIEVLLAFSERGDAIGFVELSFRAYAEGCVSDQVAYLEGLYVPPLAKARRWYKSDSSSGRVGALSWLHRVGVRCGDG